VAELLKKYEPQIESIQLLPSGGGSFEVSANETLLFSKLQTGRHAEKGEIARLLDEYLASAR
jgi:selenoprotein W-related protein